MQLCLPIRNLAQMVRGALAWKGNGGVCVWGGGGREALGCKMERSLYPQV